MFRRIWQRNAILAIACLISGCHGLQDGERATDTRGEVASDMLSGSIEIGPDAGLHMHFPGLADFIKTHGRAGWHRGLRDMRSLDDIVGDSGRRGLWQEEEGHMSMRVCDVFYWYLSKSPESKGLPALKRYHDLRERDRLIKKALAVLGSQ